MKIQPLSSLPLFLVNPPIHFCYEYELACGSLFCGKERNSRLHLSSPRPDEITTLLRAKLAALDRLKLSSQQTSNNAGTTLSYIGTWFTFIQPT